MRPRCRWVTVGSQRGHSGVTVVSAVESQGCHSGVTVVAQSWTTSAEATACVDEPMRGWRIAVSLHRGYFFIDENRGGDRMRRCDARKGVIVFFYFR